MDRETQKLLNDLTSTIDGLSKSTNTLTRFLDSQKGGAAGSTARAAGSSPDRQQDIAERASEGVGKAYDFAAQTVNASAGAMGKAFRTLSSDSTNASRAMVTFSKSLVSAPIAGLIDNVVHFTTDLHSKFLDLSRSGGNFSDGLMDMAKQAWSTGTSLEEYARMNKKYAATAATLNSGKGSLVGLAASVRQNNEKFGMFNMTVSETNDLVGDFADVYIKQGRAQELYSGKAVGAFSSVAEQADQLANAFGKNREEIVKTATDALKDVGLSAKLATLTSADQKVAGEQFTKSIMMMSSMAGQAGPTFAKMFAQTAAYDGRAFNTDAARELFQKVLPQGIDVMENTFNRVKAAPADKAAEEAGAGMMRMRDVLNDPLTLKSLSAHRESHDKYASEATQVLQLAADLRGLTDSQIKEAIAAQKAREPLTKAMNNWQNVWDRFSTGILATALPLVAKPLEAIASISEKVGNSPAWEQLKTVVTGIGERITRWINDLVGPIDSKTGASNIDAAAKWVGDKLLEFVTWTTTLNKEGNGLGGVFTWVKTKGETFGNFIEATSGLMSKLTPILTYITDNFSKLAVQAGIAYLAFKAIKFITGMTVIAASVNVVGGAGGMMGMLKGLGTKAALAAVVGAIAYGGYKIADKLGVIDKVLGTEANKREEHTDTIEQSTARVAKANPADKLDDLQRNLMEFKEANGLATEEEKKALALDRAARQAETARPGRGPAATATPAPGATEEHHERAAGREPGTTSSGGGSAEGFGTSKMSAEGAGSSVALGGLAAGVMGVMKMGWKEGLRWIIPGAETALQAADAAMNVYKWVKGEQGGGQTIQNILGNVVDGAIDLIPGKMGKWIGLANSMAGGGDVSIGRMVASAVGQATGLTASNGVEAGPGKPKDPETPDATAEARRRLMSADPADKNQPVNQPATLKDSIDKLSGLMEQFISATKTASDNQIAALRQGPVKH